MIRSFHVELDHGHSPDDEQYSAGVTPYSIIEHPFRVLVFDENCCLLGVATTALGAAFDVDEHSMKFINYFRSWANAIILARVDLGTQRIVARLGDVNASAT